MVRECETPAFFSVGCRHRRRFRWFVGKLGSSFGLNLPFPTVGGSDDEDRLSSLKKFCSGFLEREGSHLWHEETMKLPRETRMSIGMSLFLYRKVLPSSVPDLQAYFERMTTVPKNSPDEGFLKYVRRRVPELFPAGWDLTRYPSACLSSTIPIKSCTQKGQSQGGARHQVVTSERSHHDYVMAVLSGETPIQLGPSRLACVETGGKHRIVSVGDVSMNMFRPLHTAVYDHLSSFPWLLRGDAKPNSFREFTRLPGHVFCSGDYESATDNLSSEVQRLILRLILDQTVSVPSGIKESALQLLETRLVAPDGSERKQERGQLMGNLLSFPLLCIVNYLAFRYYSKTKGTEAVVRINGDDIVFRAPKEVVTRWMEGVRGSGLTLSRGKTMVDPTYFSLNSSMFRSRERRVTQVPFVRASAFFPREDGVGSLVGRYRACTVGMFGLRKSFWHVAWLSCNRRYINSSGRSLTRCLGMKVSKSELIAAGLWDRECFYLSFPDGVEKPLPPLPSVLDQRRKPEGWSLRRVDVITKEIRRISKECAGEFTALAWTPASISKLGTKERRTRWKERAFGQTPYWSPRGVRGDSRRKARLLGLSVRNAKRFLSPKISASYIDEICARNRKTVWLPDSYRPAMVSESSSFPIENRVGVADDSETIEEEPGDCVGDPIETSAVLQCWSLWRADGTWCGFGYPTPPCLAPHSRSFAA